MSPRGNGAPTDGRSDLTATPKARRTRSVSDKNRCRNFAVVVVLTLLVSPPVWAREGVPDEIVRENPAAVAAIVAGATVRTLWISGKFGEYGDPVHVIRFDREGNPTIVEGKFIRLGDERFGFSAQSNDWIVRGKFADGGGDTFLVRRTPEGRIEGVEGRFYHYGDDRFTFHYDEAGNLTEVDGKFGRAGSQGFTFSHDDTGRITSIMGKFLRFGDARFLVQYYGATKLIRSLEGRFARWGDRSFAFYYEAWPN